MKETLLCSNLIHLLHFFVLKCCSFHCSLLAKAGTWYSDVLPASAYSYFFSEATYLIVARPLCFTINSSTNCFQFSLSLYLEWLLLEPVNSWWDQRINFCLFIFILKIVGKGWFKHSVIAHTHKLWPSGFSHCHPKDIWVSALTHSSFPVMGQYEINKNSAGAQMARGSKYQHGVLSGRQGWWKQREGIVLPSSSTGRVLVNFYRTNHRAQGKANPCWSAEHVAQTLL